MQEQNVYGIYRIFNSGTLTDHYSLVGECCEVFSLQHEVQFSLTGGAGCVNSFSVSMSDSYAFICSQLLLSFLIFLYSIYFSFQFL